LAVLVGVEVVVHGAELLPGQEDAQLGDEFFELQLREGTRSVFVKGLKRSN
jgi:hypothetical protein